MKDIDNMLPKRNRFIDSMLNWYPKIKDLDIPQPRTEFVLLSKEEYYSTMDAMPNSITEKVDTLIKNKFKLPVFIRTDQSSAKHYWRNTCFYDGNNLAKHLFELCEFNHCAEMPFGLPFRSIVVREYIEMDSKYKAFEDMPVNPERRYFIKDREVVCHHFYWIKEAIRDPSAENWAELSDEMNRETKEEIQLLMEYSKIVANAIEGFWSIDFCKAKDGCWILIDMATGENSWHPEHLK